MCWYCIKKGHNVDKCKNYDKIANKRLGKYSERQVDLPRIFCNFSCQKSLFLDLILAIFFDFVGLFSFNSVF